MTAKLVLEDGQSYEGKACGADGEVWGEVVFNTSMTGYQEVLTDPSCCGHIVAMTFPLIGTTGICMEDNKDFKPTRPCVRGFVMRECCHTPGNRQSSPSLSEYLRQNNIVALEDVDTRALARHIREKGAMRGVLTTRGTPYAGLLQQLREAPPSFRQDPLTGVTIAEPLTWEDSGPHVVIMDLGVKYSTGRLLHQMGCRITLVPAFWKATEILALNPGGLVLAGGPGDPRAATRSVNTIARLIGHLPILGIGLGHQLAALALGAKTYKMKFGHRGANHPVKDLLHNKIYITTQNHGFVVDEASLPPGFNITHRHLHDGTVEGFHNEKLGLICTQYHPPAFSGPPDSHYHFNKFLSFMHRHTNNKLKGDRICP